MLTLVVDFPAHPRAAHPEPSVTMSQSSTHKSKSINQTIHHNPVKNTAWPAVDLAQPRSPRLGKRGALA
ncbi:hypothetical protein DEO72_LG5g1478 [Vigna unguiculata]|uniref:Uncharacterized protein n=1 Tax=Vigna unguiculata TaxID=3917 RepID=A0A4D6LY33_VIGUN|nr:hypothetical protein DEO72_LG5g1478 [Vigna unguiculata]